MNAMSIKYTRLTRPVWHDTLFPCNAYASIFNFRKLLIPLRLLAVSINLLIYCSIVFGPTPFHPFIINYFEGLVDELWFITRIPLEIPGNVKVVLAWLKGELGWTVIEIEWKSIGIVSREEKAIVNLRELSWQKY